jgi:hypothetical protein
MPKRRLLGRHQETPRNEKSASTSTANAPTITSTITTPATTTNQNNPTLMTNDGDNNHIQQQLSCIMADEDEQEQQEEHQLSSPPSTPTTTNDNNSNSNSHSHSQSNTTTTDRNTNKYYVRQRVLARDQDGILYFGHIRRVLFGTNRQESISVLGIFDLSIEEVETNRRGNNNHSNHNNNTNKVSTSTKDTNDNGEDEVDTKNSNDNNNNNNNNNNNTIANTKDGSINQSNGNTNTTPGWHYFIHFEGWKVNWDRWVDESDIMEATESNIEKMNIVMKTHKALQNEMKSKSKQKKIHDAGLFLKVWKQRLDGLYQEWDKGNNPPSSSSVVVASSSPSSNNNIRNRNNDSRKDDNRQAKKKKDGSVKKITNTAITSDEEKMKEMAKLALQSCLTTRDATHIQAIPLAFGLKRILVEDWEILNATSSRGGEDTDDIVGGNTTNSNSNSCGMVHCLPAKVTIRDALSAYLKEKGVVWDGVSTDRRQTKSKISSNNANDESSADPPATTTTTTTNGEKLHNSEMGPSPFEVNSEPSVADEKMTVSSEVLPCAGEGIVATESTSMTVEIGDFTNDVQVSNLKNGQGSLEDKYPVSLSPVVESTTLNDQTSSTSAESGEKLALTQQWIDMADGITKYFEQALLVRLLYPSEVAQYAILEETFPKNSKDDGISPQYKVDIYGCEHLLRLLSVMPRILEQQMRDLKSKRMKKVRRQVTPTGELLSDERRMSIEQQHQQEDIDNEFAQKGSMILAKLQDLARFLQKNQSSLFCSMYRKRTDAEVKQDMKIQKRVERRLKRKNELNVNGLSEEEPQQKKTISQACH